MRVAQGSPGVAGASLLEQVLLVTFGETKVTKTTFPSIVAFAPTLNEDRAFLYARRPNDNDLAHLCLADLEHAVCQRWLDQKFDPHQLHVGECQKYGVKCQSASYPVR